MTCRRDECDGPAELVEVANGPATRVDVYRCRRCGRRWAAATLLIELDAGDDPGPVARRVLSAVSADIRTPRPPRRPLPCFGYWVAALFGAVFARVWFWLGWP